MKKPRLNVDALEKLGKGSAMENAAPTQETKKKHPGGRPPKEKKASRIFNINFYEEDFEILSANAEALGMPISIYIKTLIRNGGGFTPPL